MRGFLQRLALGVMRPTGRIHPMVGSVFSTQHHAGPREALPQRESIFVNTQPKANSKQEQEEGVSRSFTRQEKPVVTPGSLEPNRLRAPETIYTALMSTAHALQSKSRQPESLSRAEEAGTSSSQLGDQAVVESPPQTDEHKGRAQELMVMQLSIPKMSDSTVRSSSLKAAAQQADPFPAARRSTPQENLSRRSGTPSRQPDEIQIHIGRIEVTAVQQSPAPQVVKPVRKGLSLEEYLQRANRRGR